MIPELGHYALMLALRLALIRRYYWQCSLMRSCCRIRCKKPEPALSQDPHGGNSQLQ